MADLFSHALLAYSLLTASKWLYGFDERWTAVGVAGVVLPDLVKIGMVLPGGRVEEVLGVPFDFGALGTLGGVLFSAAAASLLFGERRRSYVFLLAGGLSALLLDGLRAWADGRASAWLYPFTWWRPPTPGLYVSSDPAVLVATGALAAAVLLVDRRVDGRVGL